MILPPLNLTCISSLLTDVFETFTEPFDVGYHHVDVIVCLMVVGVLILFFVFLVLNLLST